MGEWPTAAWPNLRGHSHSPSVLLQVLFLPSSPTAYGQPMPCSIVPPYLWGIPRPPGDVWICRRYWTLHTLCFFLYMHISALKGSTVWLPYHYFYACRPLLRKIRETWTQALRYHSSWSDRGDGYQAGSIYSVAAPDRGMSHNLGWMAQDFITCSSKWSAI